MLRVLAVSALIFLTSGCSTETRESPKSSHGLVRLSDDEVKSLDPQKASDLTSLRVAMDQFEGLTRYDGDGTIKAGLAQSWTYDASGLNWRFKLKPGLKFSDGTAITAETFAATFQRLRAPQTASPNASLFDAIEQVETPAADVVSVKLRHPFPALPELLAHPAMAALPIHRIRSVGERWTMDRPLVTSGPYRLTEWALHDRIVLRRNPMWHDPPAAIPIVEWKPVDDRQSAFRQFRAGEADLVGDFPSERKAWLDSHHPGAAQVAPYRGTYYFVLNTRRPPFNDRRVRQALNITVERQAIVNKLLAIGNPPAWGVVPPQISIAHGHKYLPAWAGHSREQRIAEAKTLLKSAGYDARHPLRFEIRFNSDTEHRRIALALLDNWRPLPIKATLLNTEATLHFASLRQGDFDMARASWIGDLSVPENFLTVHSSNAGTINYSAYRNQAFDNALNKAMPEANPAVRAALMARAEAILMSDAPILPIYHYVTKNLVGHRVDGWHNNLANVHPSRTLRLKGS